MGKNCYKNERNIKHRETSMNYEDLQKEYVDCSLCGCTATKRLFEKDTLKFVRCKRCGLVYLNPRPTIEAIKKFYNPGINRWTTLKDYIDRKLPLFEDLLTKVEEVKKGRRILDVGCGIGLFLKLAKEKSWEIYGVDISTEDVKYAKEKYGLEVYQGTIMDAVCPNEFFDVVTMWDVIEHLSYPLLHLEEIKRILKKDGILFILTGNIDSKEAKRKGAAWEFLSDGSHLILFSAKTLKKFLNLAGLKPIDFHFNSNLSSTEKKFLFQRIPKNWANVADLVNYSKMKEGLRRLLSYLRNRRSNSNSSIMILAMRKD